MTYKYKIADIKIEINSDFDIIQDSVADSFAASFDKADKSFSITLGDIKVTGEPVLKTDDLRVYKDENGYSSLYYDQMINSDHFLMNDKGFGIMNINDSKDGRLSHYIFTFIDLPHIFIENNGLMLHSSYIIHNGKAIIFSGKSGIGKSTQAGLWQKYENADIINGDKSVIYRKDGKYYISSLPISGTSGICQNKTAELNSIIFLSQGRKNEIEKLSPFDSFNRIIANSTFDKWRDNELNSVMTIASEICKNCNIYHYSCLPDESSVKKLRELLSNE